MTPVVKMVGKFPHLQSMPQSVPHLRLL